MEDPEQSACSSDEPRAQDLLAAISVAVFNHTFHSFRIMCVLMADETQLLRGRVKVEQKNQKLESLRFKKTSKIESNL